MTTKTIFWFESTNEEVIFEDDYTFDRCRLCIGEQEGIWEDRYGGIISIKSVKSGVTYVRFNSNTATGDLQPEEVFMCQRYTMSKGTK